MFKTIICLFLLFNFAYAGVDPSNKIKFGDGTSGADKILESNKGPQPNPQLRYHISNLSWQFSNDGVTFNNIGTGGGGGTNVGTPQNLLNGHNPDAELGNTTHWTTSAGTFTAINTTVADGSFSFQFVTSATGQIVSSDLVPIPSLSFSKEALVRFTYLTSNTDYKLQAFDGTSVISETVLPASAGYSYGELHFIFPSSGSLQVRVFSQSAGTIKFDDVYMGENFLSNVTTTSSTSRPAWRIEFAQWGGPGSSSSPTACTSDPCTLYSTSGGVSVVNRTSVGQYVIHFSPPFGATPTCVSNAGPVPSNGLNNFTIGEGTSTTTAQIQEVAFNNNAAGADDAPSAMCFGLK